jgi:hypothetical protein
LVHIAIAVTSISEIGLVADWAYQPSLIHVTHGEVCDGRSVQVCDGRSVQVCDGRSVEVCDGRSVEVCDGRSVQGDCSK